MGWRPSTNYDLVVVALARGPVTVSELVRLIKTDTTLGAWWTKLQTPQWSYEDRRDGREKPTWRSPLLNDQNVRTRLNKLEIRGWATRDESGYWSLRTPDERATWRDVSRTWLEPDDEHAECMAQYAADTGSKVEWTVRQRDEKRLDEWVLTVRVITTRGTAEASFRAYKRHMEKGAPDLWERALQDLGIV